MQEDGTVRGAANAENLAARAAEGGAVMHVQAFLKPRTISSGEGHELLSGGALF